MISIVTLTYNNFEELAATVNSVQGSTGDFEHIVINGGTCEKTAMFLKSEFKGRSLSEPDTGISDAFNKGLSLARGEGVLFLNSGDLLIDKGYIFYLCDKIRTFDFIHADLLMLDRDVGKIYLKPHGHLKRGMPFFHPTLAVRKTIFEKIGGFSTNYKIAMDYDFVCRMSFLFSHGHYYKKAVVLMDGGGISSVQVGQGLREVKVIQKQHGLWGFQTAYFYYRKKLKASIKVLLFRSNLYALFKAVKKMKYSTFNR